MKVCNWSWKLFLVAEFFLLYSKPQTSRNTPMQLHFDMNTWQKRTEQGNCMWEDTVCPWELSLCSRPGVFDSATPLKALLAQTAPAWDSSWKPDTDTSVVNWFVHFICFTWRRLCLSDGNLRINVAAVLRGDYEDVCFSWRRVRLGGLHMCTA